MEYTSIDKLVYTKSRSWLSDSYDEETRKKVASLIENDADELQEAFYKDLEFGTGGLRGIMGVGSNRMNIYTVGMATQGLCNYLAVQFPNESTIKIAIAYDCRNNSKLFAETAAKICAGNGMHVYLFDNLRPTPELSFAVRHYACKAGIVITASHNPKEYNGFKAYWEDGGQLISPHDKNVIAEVQNIKDISELRFINSAGKIELIGDEFDKEYIAKIKSLSLSPEVIQRNKGLTIVYTPIHGTGVTLVPMALKEYGFNNVISVPEQNIVSGDFPTVHSPNPEEPAALSMALKKAKEVDADIVMATDPDADRVGIAIKNSSDEFVLLNGNQAACLLLNYLLLKWNEKGKITGREYIVKTIVTTELLAEIAKKYNVEYYDVLTGFKYIADIIKQNEGIKTFIGGGEESYGYLAGEFVRDKDAVMACALLAEAAAYAKDQGMSMFDQLLEIYISNGFYKEKLVSIVKKGKAGADEIEKMMLNFRNNPPKEIKGSKVVTIKDYMLRKERNCFTGELTDIDLPQSNVLQFFTEDGTKISIRPSGTEPKIKFYISVKKSILSKSEYKKTDTLLENKINDTIEQLTNHK